MYFEEKKTNAEERNFGNFAARKKMNRNFCKISEISISVNKSLEAHLLHFNNKLFDTVSVKCMLENKHDLIMI